MSSLYATMPSEYWSDAQVTASATHCSGLMYAGVPTMVPVFVGRRLGHLGDAEVGDDGIAVAVEQDVGGLHVAMDDTAPVGIGEPAADLEEDRAHHRDGQHARSLEHDIQRAAVHVLHDEEVESSS